MLTSWLRRVPNLVAGLLAGIAAAIVTTLVMVLSRYYLGIMPPPESVPDRVASLLDIKTFFRLFGEYGGYNGLKQFGIMSGLRALFAVGAVVGVVYALVLESVPSRRSRRWILGTSMPAFLFMVVAVLAVWIGFVIFLWPVLPSNYRGVPYSQARILSIVALLVWFATFALTVLGTYRFITRRMVDLRDRTVETTTTETDTPVPAKATVQPLSRPLNRRAVLAAGVSAALIYPIFRTLDTMYKDATFFYDGKTYHGEDIQPIAPVDRFYSVTKNVVDPNINRDLWRIEIGGHVDDAKSYSFDDLQQFEQVDEEATLMCISNRVGSGLFGNAEWRGVRMKDVLEASGVKDGALEVLVSAADGYSDSFSIDKALSEVTLIVYLMNGEPLTRIHGGPVRIIVPGLYGEKNVKWVTRIDVATEDRKGLYENQGWGPDFAPKVRSDVFAPTTGGNDARGGWKFNREFKVNETIELKGRAFAPDDGIATVEVSTDEGKTWNPATLYYPGTEITWTLWSYSWKPTTAGTYVIIPRCVSNSGEVQEPEPTSIVPSGAQGYMKVTAVVK